MDKFKAGDRIVWNGEVGTFLRYEDQTKYSKFRVGIMKMDSDKDNDIEQEDKDKYIDRYQQLELSDVAVIAPPGTDPIVSGPGYVIDIDGTVYALKHMWMHGVISAMLRPELAKESGYVPPAHGAANVYEYQRFELDNTEEIRLIRISHRTHIRTGRVKPTAEQVEGIRRCMRACSIKLTDRVETDYREQSLRDALKFLNNPKADPYE